MREKGGEGGRGGEEEEGERGGGMIQLVWFTVQCMAPYRPIGTKWWRALTT